MVTVYAVCAVVGVLVLVASIILGDLGSGVGHGVDSALPWVSAPALAAAVGVFGVVGWPLSAGTSLPGAVVAAIAVASAVAAYGLLMLVLRGMRHAQSGTVASLRAAVGSIGEVSMSIPPGGWGQVSYLSSEAARAVTRAILVDGQSEAPAGAQVLIVDVDGDRLVVQPLNTQS